MEPVVANRWTSPASVSKTQWEWTCAICDRSMAMIAQRNHLAGKKHNAMVEKSGQYEKHQELLSKQPPAHLQSPPPPPPPPPTTQKYSLQDLPEIDLQQPLPPVGESADPVKLSYLRMKKSMAYYSVVQEKHQSQNTTAVAEHPAQAVDLGAMPPVELPETDSDNKNDQPITNPANVPGGRSVLMRCGKPSLNPWVEPVGLDPPSAVLATLKAARYIEDFSSIKYPANILAPKNLTLNPTGKFIYEKDFLLQFQCVFTDKPTTSWDKKMLWAFGSPDVTRAPTSPTRSGFSGYFKPVSSAGMHVSAQWSEEVRVNSPATSVSESPKPDPPANVLTTSQRLDQWRAGFLHMNPSAARESSFSADRSGVVGVQTNSDGLLETSDILKAPRTRNRSSRGSRKGAFAEGMESREGGEDRQSILTVDGSGFGSFPRNGREDRFLVREKLPIPDKPPYTAHVANINFDISEDEISEFFSQCDLMKIKLIRDKIDGRLKGFGYIDFNTREGLVGAMELNGALLAGRNIRINVAEPLKAQSSTANLFTKPLHSEATPTATCPARPRAASLAKWRDSVVLPLEKKTPPKFSRQKWTCTVCACTIDLDQKEMHLNGKSHARKFKKPQMLPGDDPDGLNRASVRRDDLDITDELEDAKGLARDSIPSRA